MVVADRKPCLGIVLASQMRAGRVIPAPLLGSLAAGGVQEDLTQLLVGDVPSSATGPGPAVAITTMGTMVVREDGDRDDESQEKPHQNRREGYRAEAPQDIVGVAAPRYRDPQRADQGCVFRSTGCHICCQQRRGPHAVGVEDGKSYLCNGSPGCIHPIN